MREGGWQTGSLIFLHFSHFSLDFNISTILRFSWLLAEEQQNGKRCSIFQSLLMILLFLIPPPKYCIENANQV